MSWFIECPFCHKSIFRWFYSSHERAHTARRPDGQMNEHITAAPSLRYNGPLDGIPQNYRHTKCGVGTTMPEEIIRTYLVNPLTYNDSSFCCGCSDYVISSELVWIDTGEPVMTYMSKLRADYIKKTYGINPTDADVILTPSTVKKIQSMGSQGTQPLLALEMIDRNCDVHYKLDVVASWNRHREDLLEHWSIGVVVQKRQRRKLKGTIIHFNETLNGFTVARVYPWK
jgi:hypothetical protein